ncbi:MAG: XdhC family protein [Herpetosiphonaceae bacterium]|nr:XdhC family protein [Herpetosiphonaceae bacterium]
MIFTTLVEALDQQHPVALATVVRGSALGAKLLLDEQGLGLGTLGDEELDGAVRAVALALLDAEQSETRPFHTLAGEAVEVLIETYPAPPHLVIVGGVHIAIPLTDAAKLLGFRVTVVDPRTAFLTAERFPQADALVAEWPDEALPGLQLNRSTAVVILTHDPKLDNPATEAALRYPVRYLGAIGSTKTQDKRRAALHEAGVSEEDLARIHGPIGLPIGGVSPGEIAISILAEIIAVWRGKQP